MAREDYVSLEQAKALKELEFDWECYSLYNENGKLSPNLEEWCDIAFLNYNYHDELCSAPTLAQAQKWMREVKELDIDITLFREIDAREEPVRIKRYYNCEIAYSEDAEDLSEDFDSYEEALSAGIDKAIEILKEEINNEA